MAGSPQHATLVANTVTTFTFDKDFSKVEILNVDGAAEVYATVDGVTAPAVGGTGSYVLPAAISSLELSSPATAGSAATTIVRLISAGTPKVSVRGL